MIVVVGTRVGQIEALRQVEVELHRAALPGATERVGQVNVDLRSVEGAVALVDAIIDTARLQDTMQRLLGLVPDRVVPHPHLGPCRQLDLEVHRE